MKYILLALAFLISFPQAFANVAPVPVMTLTPQTGYVPLTVNFNGSGSYDPDGTISSYLWTYGDGSTGSGVTTSRTYTTAGTRTVRLRVVDNGGATSAVTYSLVTMTDANPPALSVDLDEDTVLRTSTPMITATFSDAETGINTAATRFYLDGNNVTANVVQSGGQAILQFTNSWPLSPGNHLLRVNVYDNRSNQASKVIHFSYDASVPAAANYINGKVLDQAGAPLANVNVSSVDGPVGPILSGTTNVNGDFSLPFTIGGDYKLSIVKSGYVQVYKSISVIAGIDSVLPQVLVAEADIKSTTINAAVGGTATNTSGSIAINIPANSIDSTKAISFTEAVTGATLQDPLPNGTVFTYAFNALPSGTSFSTPASMTIDNTLGFEPGFEIPVGVTDANPSGWADSGYKGVVSPDGTKINFLVAHFSDYDINLGAVGGPTTNPITPGAGPGPGPGNPGTCSANGSRIDTCSSSLSIDYDLPALTRRGKNVAPRLTYTSTTADPKIIISVQTEGLEGATAPDKLIQITDFGGEVDRKEYVGEAGIKSSQLLSVFTPKKRVGTPLATQSLPYRTEIAGSHTDFVFGITPYFGAVTLGPTLIPVREPVLLREYVEDRAIVNNQKESSFGAGWSISGWERIHQDADGTLTLVDGKGFASIYTPLTKGTGKRLIQKGVSDSLSNLHYSKGFFYGADCRNNQVYRMDLKGRLTTLVGAGKVTDLNCPTAVIPSRKGGLYIADSGNKRIIYIGENNKVSVVAGTDKAPANSPSFISEDNVLAVHFIDGDEVKVISPFNGEILTIVGKGPEAAFDYDLKKPVQLMYDDYHNLVVLDEERGEVIKFYTLSKTSRVILKQKGIKALARDPMLRRFYTLDNKGLLSHWMGWGHKETKKLFNTGGSLKTWNPITEKDRQPFVNSLAFSPEIGLVTATDEGIQLRGLTDTNKLTVDIDYLSPIADFSQLKKLTDGTFEKVLVDRTVYKYDSAGYITQKIETNGSITSYQYTTTPDHSLTSITLPTNDLYSFSYDTRGYVTSITDPANRVTTLTINTNGDLSAIIDSNSETDWEYTYDANHLLVSKKDISDLVTEYSYQLSRVVSAKYPGNRIKDIFNRNVDFLFNNTKMVEVPRIDSNKIETIITSPEGRALTYITDRNAVHHAMIDGEGNKTYVLRNTDSLPVEVSSSEGRKTFTGYDSLGRVITSKGASGLYTYTYDPVHNKIKTKKDALNVGETFNYNAQGLVISHVSTLGHLSTFTYNALGSITSISDPLNSVTTFSYDSKGNLSSKTDPLGQKTTYTRDNVGNLANVADPLGFITSFEYDSKNQMTKSIDHLQQQTDFTYYPSGQLESLTDARSNTTNFQINDQQKVTKVINPLLQEVNYTYDNDGNILSKITKAGQLISFSYNGNNKLVTKTMTGDSIVYNYDKDGLLTSSADSDSELRREYDSHGRLITESSSHYSGVVSYQYDARGSVILTKLAFPNGHGLSVDTQYHPNRTVGRRSLRFGSKVASYDRWMDNNGRVVGYKHPNNYITSITYDKNSRPLRMLTEAANSVPFGLNYQYTANGNISVLNEQLSNQSRTHRYEYDAINRLVKEDSYKTSNYVLDAVGNDSARGGVFSALNQLSEDASFNYEYDLNGNQTKKISKATNGRNEYSWTPDGELKQTKVYSNATSLSKTIDYKYDIAGRRIERSVTNHLVSSDSYVQKYVYDGDHILAILDGEDNLISAFLHGEGMDDPMGLITDYNMDGEFDVLSLIKDHQNSVRLVTNEAREVVQSIGYSAYGETFIANIANINSKGLNVFYYTGRELEKETGDYYYRARYYNPSTGRFLSEDPIGFHSGDTNLYRYTSSNPLRYRDPYGKDSWLDAPTCWIGQEVNPDLVCGDWTDNLNGTFCQVWPNAKRCQIPESEPEPAPEPAPEPTPTPTPTPDPNPNPEPAPEPEEPEGPEVPPLACI